MLHHDGVTRDWSTFKSKVRRTKHYTTAPSQLCRKGPLNLGCKPHQVWNLIPVSFIQVQIVVPFYAKNPFEYQVVVMGEKILTTMTSSIA